MEKIVMVLKVENSQIKVKDSLGNEKEIAKANLLVTDGNDRFVAEAFDKTADMVAKANLQGKLCSIVCQLSAKKWKRDGKEGISNVIRVTGIKSLFETMDEYLDEEKKEAQNANQ